ncbi:hypothetical protein EDD37DRAFT_568116 [Exophiala viscosa]|uniref:uncharacterized protein n=1 Tax=Exophiala viscosa TaxID=2486360 RepID=UPI00219AB912|nr:hypothetical protein EDD37DRAFT_568116 [Exophiala viscosa]
MSLASADASSWQELAQLILQCLGAITLLRILYHAVDVARLWLLPPHCDIRRYYRPNAWALVTGSSTGIGLWFAWELAAAGFNVILLGHKLDELHEAQARIEAHFPHVQTRILVMDCSKATASEINEHLRSVTDLNLTVLINNVGGVITHQSPRIKPLTDYTPEEIDLNISLNAVFMTHMTRFLLPVLASNRSGPSLILNMSSGAQEGIPGVSIYSATKSYITALTKSVNRECKAAGVKVDIISIVPGEVTSQTNKPAHGFGVIDARPYAEMVLQRAPAAAARGVMVFSPYWAHALAFWVMRVLPESIRLRAFVALVLRDRNVPTQDDTDTHSEKPARTTAR